MTTSARRSPSGSVRVGALRAQAPKNLITAAFTLALLLLACLAPSGAAAVTQVEGVLYEQHGDTLSDKTVDRAFFVATTTGPVRLSDEQPAGLIGQRIALADADTTRPGYQGQARALDPEQHLVDAPPPGPQTVLTLILTTPDDPVPVSTDPDNVRAEVFTDPGSTGAYYAEQSNGATTLAGRVDPAGDVLGPIALDTPMAGCPTEVIANEADARAAAMGYPPASYDHVIYLMPYSGECNFGGLGQMPGRRSWSNGYLLTSVLAHELGHNMGAHHANLLSCIDPDGDATPYSSTCASSEYGDPFDVMGSSTALMGAFHRYQIGQLPGSQVVRLRGSATVSVASSEDFASALPRLVLVPIKHPHEAVDEYFAIDARTPLSPFDQWSTGEPITTGLTIRKVSEGGYPSQTQLIDMHPAGPIQDSPLQPGETFEDPQDGISISVGGDAGVGLQAAVTVPPSVDDVPPSVDDVPPSPPSSLRASASASGVHLNWTSGSDDVGVDHYRLLRDAAQLGTTSGVSFDDPPLPSQPRATYSVITVDTAGNESTPLSMTVPLVHLGRLPEKDEREAKRRRVSIGDVIQRDGSGRLYVRIYCGTGTGPCAGTVHLVVRAHGRRDLVGAARYRVRSGGSARVRVTVAGRRASLASRRALRLRASVTVSGGPSVSRSCRIVAMRSRLRER